MNNIIIQNWNSVVKNNDRVFVLGDFCLSGKDKIIKCGRALNGRKTLIKGNHDNASLSTYYEAGFEIVSKHPIFFESKIIFSHEPIILCPYINIHGHIHDKEIDKKNYPNSINVSIEKINYFPIALEKVLKIWEIKGNL